MQKRFVSFLLAIAALLALSGELTRDRTGDSGLQLERPSFLALASTAQAQEKGVNFLQQEAGISAYVKVDQKIDLARVRGVFKTEEEPLNDQYLIGEVALADLPPEAHPHVYVNKDGWIVAYYSNNAPSSKIMQWIGYGGGVISKTTLEDAIRKVYDALPLPYPQDVKYYHFKYPNATRIMVITKINSKRDVTESFYLTIPPTVRLLEASWALNHSGGSHGSLGIGDKWITGDVGNGFLYDFTNLITTQAKESSRHIIKLYNYGGSTSVAIVLIY
jgi:hypothetical protein